MLRTYKLSALVLFAGVLALGCGKKDTDRGGPSGGRTPEEKREAVAQLRQIGVAMHIFQDQTGHFPAGVVGPKAQLGLSWRVAILPQIEQESLYREFKLDEPWDSEHNKKFIPRMPKLYESPGAVAPAGKTYLRSFVGPSAFIPGPQMGPKGPLSDPWINQTPGSLARGRRITDFSDGTSNTILVVEAADAVEWTKPDDLPFPDVPGAPASSAPLPKLGQAADRGFHALLGDGSVRFVSDTIKEKTLRALITLNGGEVIRDD